jgi:hypothetical protein
MELIFGSSVIYKNGKNNYTEIVMGAVSIV